MATRTREIEEIVCDSCGKIEEMCDGAPVDWYTGEAVLHNYLGGVGADWAACSAAHIKKAVLNALNRDEDQD